jgi:DNA-binding CsgD family transcriptional regulator
LEQDKDYNSNIQRAKAFRDSYKNKLRGIEADRDIEITAERLTVTREREGLLKSIERMRAEIQAAEDKLAGLNDKLKSKMDLIDSQFETAKAKLDKDVQVADEYADMDPKDVSGLTGEVELAESMKKHLNEYGRMKRMQDEIESLKVLSDEYTRKIELARTLPGEILKTATIPVAGLTVENGIPLINGLPVSNLSEGEQLSLCVDVTIGKPGTLQIILLDGIEKLSDREMHNFNLLGSGLGNTQIAHSLSLSVKTIESHRENIKRKLDLSCSRDLIACAKRYVEETFLPAAKGALAISSKKKVVRFSAA